MPATTWAMIALAFVLRLRPEVYGHLTRSATSAARSLACAGRPSVRVPAGVAARDSAAAQRLHRPPEDACARVVGRCRRCSREPSSRRRHSSRPTSRRAHLPRGHDPLARFTDCGAGSHDAWQASADERRGCHRRRAAATAGRIALSIGPAQVVRGADVLQYRPRSPSTVVALSAPGGKSTPCAAST